jgi:hypothetical protein
MEFSFLKKETCPSPVAWLGMDSGTDNLLSISFRAVNASPENHNNLHRGLRRLLAVRSDFCQSNKYGLSLTDKKFKKNSLRAQNARRRSIWLVPRVRWTLVGYRNHRARQVETHDFDLARRDSINPRFLPV